MRFKARRHRPAADRTRTLRRDRDRRRRREGRRRRSRAGARDRCARTPRRWSRSTGRFSWAIRPRSTTKARSTASRSRAARRPGSRPRFDEDRFIPGFAAGIVGMKRRRDAATINVDLPGRVRCCRSWPARTPTFTITVHEVKEPELPALDDEFAKRVSSAPDPRRAQGRTAGAASTPWRPKSARRADQRRAARQAPGRQRVSAAAGAGRARDRRAARRVAAVRRADGHLVGRLPQAESAKPKNTIRADFREEAERRVKTTLLIEEIAKRGEDRGDPGRTSRPSSVRSRANTGSRVKRSSNCWAATSARWSTGSCAPRPSIA